MIFFNLTCRCTAAKKDDQFIFGTAMRKVVCRMILEIITAFSEVFGGIVPWNKK